MKYLKKLKLTEGRNTGIPKIKRALKNNGSRDPIFETNDTRDYFITTIFMHNGFENEKILCIKTSNKASDKTSNKASDKTSNKASDKILDYLQENVVITTITASQILGLSTQRARAILGKMAKDGLITAEGANKNRKYKRN